MKAKAMTTLILGATGNTGNETIKSFYLQKNYVYMQFLKTTNVKLHFIYHVIIGKRVALQLLERDQKIRAIVRSKDNLPPEIANHPNANITEASILDMNESDLKDSIEGCDAVVQCLGHNMNFKGDSNSIVVERLFLFIKHDF